MLLGYVAVSFLYFGRPIVSHPGRYLIGYGRDPQIFVWSFAWYLHALETWQNPFVSHAIYAPAGINLVWATTRARPAFLFAPLTALFGPAVSYNVAAILAPAVSAWTAYLLCRHLTRSLWPSLVGGYLFGFSSYMLGQQQGHLHMTAVFLLPLIALTTVRYLEGELGGRGFAWRLGLLFGLQFWLSTELAVTAALLLALALGARLLDPSGDAKATSRFSRAVARRDRAGGARRGAARRLRGDRLPGAVDQRPGDLRRRPRRTSCSPRTSSGSAARGSPRSPTTSAATTPRRAPTSGCRPSRSSSGTRRACAGRSSRATCSPRSQSPRVLTLGTGLVWRGRIDAWLPWREVAKLPILDNILPAGSRSTARSQRP